MTPETKQNEQLLLEMQGLPSDGGKVPPDLFISAFDALRGLMEKIVEQRTGKKKSPEARLFIDELSHSSPVRGGIGVVSTDGNGLAGAIMADAESAFLRVRDGEGDDIPDPMLQCVENIVKGYEKEQISAMKIQRLNGRASPYPAVEVTRKFLQSLERIRKREIRGVTTIVGKVEALNLHHPSNIRLRIYPEIGQSVECRIPIGDKETALRAIDKRAAITGEARYRPDAVHPLILRPYRIDTEKSGIEIFEPGPNPPKISDFHGAFPNLTGGKDTLEYLRELRGED